MISLIVFSLSTDCGKNYFDFTKKEKKNKVDLYSVCIDHLKTFESFQSKEYLDTDGSPTIGYGHHILNGEHFPKNINESVADSILRSDFDKRLKLVQKYHSELTVNKELSVALFIFNIGQTKYRKSTLMKLIGSNQEIDNEIVKWCHYTTNNTVHRSDNLLNRRLFELKLYKNEKVL